MAELSNRTIRSACMAVTFIARQFGKRINADYVENSIEQGTLSNPKEFSDFFAQQGVLTKPRRCRAKDLLEKRYLYPCVGVLKTGQAVILIGFESSEPDSPKNILSIDPLDPTAKVLKTNQVEFIEKWSEKIILVSPATGNNSLDRIFDWMWFVPEFRRYSGTLVLLLLMSLIIHGLGVAPIIYIQIALDKVLGFKAIGTLYVLTGGMIAALLFLAALNFARDCVISHIASVIEARLAGDAFDKLLKLPAQQFQVTSAAEMESKVLSVNTIQNFISRKILANAFDVIGIIVFLPILIGYSPILALIVVIFSILQGVIDLYSKKLGFSHSVVTTGANSARYAALRETISGIDTVKTLSQEPIQRRQWRDATAKYIRAGLQAARANSAAISVNAFAGNLLTVAIIFTGINLVFAGSLSAGAIISCNMLGAKLVSPVKALITFLADMTAAEGAIERLGSIWNANPERVGLGPQRVISGNFSLKDVSVKFGDKFALENLSGEIPGRKKIGIVGRSGAGKTTLLRLLQGLIKTSSGTVEVDGNNLTSLDLSFYRQQVCLIDNSPTFFSGTIEQNIRRVRPNISATEFDEILRISGLSEISNSLPEGLGTTLDLHASCLSQSHKLIVALARGLASAPNLILLDETTSNLDKFMQIHFVNNLAKISDGKTFVLVSNDLRFLPNFDWVLVMDKGRIVSQGTHEDLLASSELYRQLYDSEKQLSQF
jgi:ABC-type bacteriocin/lantibiotic exporter with double-glycine peptidase domain